jgi:NAD(P)-dependent dehydrogenase (short-subunit alcohol dehydrogenase family)
MNALRGQTILVTGAARGIGAAAARGIAAAGGNLILIDVGRKPLHELAAELGRQTALAITADVTDLSAMDAAVATGIARFGGIQTVVANAGIASYGSVLGVHPATFRRVLDINVNGVFHTVRAALPSLIESKGYILVVSALGAFAPAPGLAAYNASKAGSEHFANALRLEVAHRGIDVGVAYMSWIETPLVQDARKDLRAFNELVSRLPPPLNRTTTAETCVNAFVKGITKRRRRIYVPGWVRLVRASRNLISSPLGDQNSLKYAPELLPKMDEEVRRLGRSTSARNT